MAINFTSHLNRDMSPFITKAKDHKVDAALWTRIGEKTTRDNKERRVNKMNANVADILSRADEDLYDIKPEDIEDLVAQIDAAISGETSESGKEPVEDTDEKKDAKEDVADKKDAKEDADEDSDEKKDAKEDAVDESEKTDDKTEVTDDESIDDAESDTGVPSEENLAIQKEIDELSEEDNDAYREYLADNQLKDSPESYTAYKESLKAREGKMPSLSDEELEDAEVKYDAKNAMLFSDLAGGELGKITESDIKDIKDNKDSKEDASTVYTEGHKPVSGTRTFLSDEELNRVLKAEDNKASSYEASDSEKAAAKKNVKALQKAMGNDTVTKELLQSMGYSEQDIIDMGISTAGQLPLEPVDLPTEAPKKSFLDMLPETGKRQPNMLVEDPNAMAQPKEFNYGPTSFLDTVGQTRQPQLLKEDPNAKLKNQKPNRTFLQMIGR